MLEVITGETPEQKHERHKAEFIKVYGLGDVLGHIDWLEYQGSGKYSEDIRRDRWNKSDLIYKAVSMIIKEGK
jgi:hypothetical protein